MKKLLLIIDFQNDFVSGSLGFENAKKLEPLICSRIEEYRKNGQNVAFTLDTHSDNYLDTREGQVLPVKHCIKDSDGWKLYGKVASMVEKQDKLFIKHTFGSADLLTFLQEERYDEIELAGLVTNICVLSNAVICKTALPEAEIFIYENCVSSYDKELHYKTLDVMKGLQITVIEDKD